MARFELPLIRSIQCGIVLLFALPTTGQALVREEQVAPIGSTWQMLSIQDVPDMMPPTQDSIWAFSNLTTNTVFGAAYTVLDPDDVPGHLAFPGADRVVREVFNNAQDEATHVFQNVDESDIHEVGRTGPVSSRSYVQPALVAIYPMDEGATVTANFCFVSSTASGSSDHCGNTTITHEATGPLELPYGNFPVAKLVSTRWNIGGASGTSPSQVVEYAWFVPGTPFPALRFTWNLYADGSSSRMGQLLEEGSLTTVQELASARSLAVFPNPTNGTLTIARRIGDTDVQVYAADGRSVNAFVPTAQITSQQVDLSGSPAGVYHVVVNGT
ncbi:MAG: T9SS type A sorting domain-containing protein [Flavobacteriales bacterium]|nr:T9SS type A sorting domain-containing protein [Flavobacteriales bacterium]